MILRNGDYVCVDGSIFSIEGVQSMYISRLKTGIDIQYLDGHSIEIKYKSIKVCKSSWNELLKITNDIVESDDYVLLYDTMLVRLDSVQHIEFDGVDNRFALLYKTGECFIFDFQSATITRSMYRKIVECYFKGQAGKTRNSADSRMRADFWRKVTRNISGLITGEQLPNERYWRQIDKALINADEWKRDGDR